ncbi:NAD(P)/FAD-dependent oxidoreductase [Rossellomorea vietnamensis]|uniref:FAD-dependent oxidoreductase n=1 Tax=Rossellomorea vietnamensis TaxID=218284 RepID=A0ACD4C2S3_9BACI|nr:FAD-dependent oxidoreductase [Rossellomorea vietnamensis]UXH42707.1 FAD-dependent oxidoreductase [Rossellomorea vietnamensis]WQI94188.1 FAD-dependent oxidoreductase [Rossellomorea vietnamensis]
MEQYDLIVIGGGAGGLTVASGAASLGAKVALVEKSGLLGGDCLHFGCVPSKAFIQSAREVATIRSAADYGFETKGSVDMKKVKERVKGAISHIQQHDDPERFLELGVDIYFGAAEFLDPHTILVEKEDRISGKRVVVATGSSPLIPEIDGLLDVEYHTNETVFEVDELPSRVVFIGGGPIGLELAQAFSHLGSEAVVLEQHDEILVKEDKEIREVATGLLEKDIQFVFGAEIKRVSKRDGLKVVHYVKDGEEQSIEGDLLFLATGRKPGTESLNLSAAGVETDDRGFIEVNDELRTNQSHIFAIGDVNGRYPFTHGAGMEGKLVVQNAVFGLKRNVSYNKLPWTTYTTPEIFHIGLTEEEAVEKGMEYKVYKKTLDEVDRFVADQKTEGLVKIITDLKGKILGAHAVGAGAGDWMQPVVFAMEKGSKIGALSNMVYPYPNHAAAVQQTADLYWREKLFDGVLPVISKKYVELFR